MAIYYAGGVGTGKSITALGYFFYKETKEMKNKKDLYIITTARKRDSLEWDKECNRFKFYKEKNPYKIKIIIDSWNNIQKYVDVKSAFFIFDEQRVVGSGKWVKAFLKIANHNKWILLSATPGDTWSDYIPVFVANHFYKNRSEFLRRHAVYNRFLRFPKIDRYLETDLLKKYKNQILVDMPYLKQTKRNCNYLKCDYDKVALDKIIKQRWNIFDNKPIRDISQACYLMRKVSNINPSRITMINNIYKKHKKIIIFYNFNYELEILKKYCEDNKILYAEWNRS